MTAENDLQDRIRTLLDEHGPMTVDELAERAGVDVHEVDDVVATDDLVELPHERVATAGVLEGTVHTHRVTAAELDLGVLHLAPDLAAIRAFDERAVLTAADGTDVAHLHLGHRGQCALRGADGWLDGYADGQLLACRIDDGVLTVWHVEAPPDADGTDVEDVEDVEDGATRLRNAAEAWGLDEPVDIDDLAAAFAVNERVWLSTPRPPLGDLLVAAGLERHGEQVGPQGFDWMARERQRRLERLVQVAGLSDEQHTTLAAALDALSTSAPTDEQVAIVVELLAEPEYARIVHSVLRPERGGLDQAGPTLERAEATATGPALAGAQWLGIQREAPDALALMQRLDGLVAAHDDFEPALEQLASLREAMGDVDTSLRLYLQAGYGNDEPVVQELRELQARTKAPVGRNDPCPCGSGKKFKQCHLGQEDVPVGLQTRWLWRRAVRFLHREGGDDLLQIASAYAGPFLTGKRLLAFAITDDVVADLAVHEGGWFERFVDTYRTVLPERDLALAAQWLETRRRLVTVVSVDRGEGFVLRDEADGEQIAVHDRLASRTAQPGHHLALRLAPDAGGALVILGGGTFVRDDAVDELRETLRAGVGAADLAAALHLASRPAPG